MKKYRRIFLIDRGIQMCQYILQNTNWIIVCLVVEKNNVSLFVSNPRVKQIVPYDDLLHIHNTENINLELLESMRDIQLDCETTLHRCFHNNVLSKYIYYSHLSFFYGLFSSHKLDFVLCSETNLGVPSITIPLGLARNLNIPAYTIDPDLSFSLIYKYNTECFLDTKTISLVDLKNKAYVPYKSQKIDWKSSIRNFLKKVILVIGGQLLVEFCVCLIHFDFFHYERLGVHFNYWDKLKSYFRFKKAIRFYHKHSVVPDFKKKYIYFSLHVEPEAVILARVGLDNQLLLIKMLADALPEDWIIYVKEHPHQLKINTPEGGYFINNLDYYKNINFYQEILKIKNVHLVKLNMHPKQITKYAKAVASIGGSISVEAWLLKKPAINFCPKQAFASLLSNSLNVESYQDLKKAISLLYNNYKDFQNTIDIQKDQDKIQTYMLPQDSSAFPIILKAIINDIGGS